MAANDKRIPTKRPGLGAQIRRRFLEPAAHRRLSRRAQPRTVRHGLEADPEGRADLGRAMARGRFPLAGSEIETSPETLWRDVREDKPAEQAALAFEWLNDLSALDGPAARRAARIALAAWMQKHGLAHDPLVWRPDIAARRLRALLINAPLILSEPGDDLEDGVDPAPLDLALFGRSLDLHVEWLRRTIAAPPPGPDRLTAAVALALSTLAFDDRDADRDAFATMLDAAIDGAVGPDGAVIDRSPEGTWRAFAQLSHYRDQAETLQAPVSDVVLEAIARLGPALRFFRAADGGLALFHGSEERGDGRVDAALARVRAARAPARRLPDAGFERLSGGRVTVLLDASAAKATAAAMRGHASALAIEVCAGRRRLIVNCGSGATLDADWARACRGAPAHSTLTYDGADFVRREATESDVGPVVLCHGPDGVQVERKEERNGVWLMGAHDGYRISHGVRLTRRLFLSADGGDFRGEDTAQPPDADARKTYDKRLGQRGRRRDETPATGAIGGPPLRARFHLHPDVAAAVVADGEAITLRLPHGEVWVMRQAGGALALEDSVYLGRGGDPEPSRQIVVTAGARQEKTQIRWAFRRVGELSQLPRDVEALLAETSLRAPAPDAEDEPGSAAP